MSTVTPLPFLHLKSLLWCERLKTCVCCCCRDSFAQLIANLEEIRKRYVDLPVRKQMWVITVLTSTPLLTSLNKFAFALLFSWNSLSCLSFFFLSLSLCLSISPSTLVEKLERLVKYNLPLNFLSTEVYFFMYKDHIFSELFKYFLHAVIIYRICKYTVYHNTYFASITRGIHVVWLAFGNFYLFNIKLRFFFVYNLTLNLLYLYIFYTMALPWENLWFVYSTCTLPNIGMFMV